MKKFCIPFLFLIFSACSESPRQVIKNAGNLLIKIRMEELNLKQLDLVPVIGGKGRVSEILNRKRKLTLGMIRRLAEKLDLSADMLIRDYQLAEE